MWGEGQCGVKGQCWGELSMWGEGQGGVWINVG